MHIWTMIVALISTLAGGIAAAQTSSTIPGSPEEALRQLRRTQAAESDWSTFPDYASVAMKNRVREGKGQPKEADVAIFLRRASDGTAQLMVIANGRSVDTRASFDNPNLDASKATFVREESVTAAGRTYRTKLYTFDIKRETPGKDFISHHRYWLAAGVPSGVVRHEWFGARSEEERKPEGSGLTVLSELDVPFTVQREILRAYCYSSQADWSDGSKDLMRYCKHASVPGGIVRLEQRELKNGVEVRFETTDLEEVTPPRAPSSSSKNTGCDFLSSLLGDQALRELEKGDYKSALVSFDAILRTNPTCARAYNDRGYAKLKLEDRAGALADFDRAIAMEPTLIQAYVNRAVLKRESNDLQGALAECNAALRIDPKYFNALVNRMAIYLRLFDDDRAIRDYKAALEAVPSSGDSLDRVVAQERKRRAPEAER